MRCLCGLGVGFLILIKWIVLGGPVSEFNTRYEEYVIEHEISATQAKNTALLMDVNSLVTPVGCQTCTRAEIAYCLGSDLINDHCCCDKRYHETLPYVPHTCYLGPKLCRITVGDCDYYSKLKSCCCEKYVLEKWKAKASASYLLPSTPLSLGLILACIFLFV